MEKSQPTTKPRSLWEIQADPNIHTILGVLKTYPTNEVAIIGCHAARISRKSCEYDLLVVSKDPTPPKYVGVGDFYAEIVFKPERELRSPDSEFAASLAGATVLRDSSLLLAGAIAASKRRFRGNCSKAAEARLAAALKALGRVDENLGGNLPEADFWLVAAATDLCRAEVFSNLMVPSPSHLVAQMKSVSGRKTGMFKEWSEASGFRLASKTSCENRLDAVGVLYDIMRTTAMDTQTSLRFGRYRYEDAMDVVSGKAAELMASLDTVECYSYLGLEMVRTVLDLHVVHRRALRKEPDYSDVTGELTRGKDRLISEELLKGMGIVRPRGLVKAGAEALRSAVSSLAAKM